jgi:hypothetical protein
MRLGMSACLCGGKAPDSLAGELNLKRTVRGAVSIAGLIVTTEVAELPRKAAGPRKMDGVHFYTDSFLFLLLDSFWAEATSNW